MNQKDGLICRSVEQLGFYPLSHTDQYWAVQLRCQKDFPALCKCDNDIGKKQLAMPLLSLQPVSDQLFLWVLLVCSIRHKVKMQGCSLPTPKLYRHKPRCIHTTVSICGLRQIRYP